MIAFAVNLEALSCQRLKEVGQNLVQQIFVKPSDVEEPSNKIRAKFDEFIAYREANSTSGIKYVLEFVESEEDGLEGVTFFAYCSNLRVSFEFSSILSRPVATGDKGTDWIELEVDPPSQGFKFVQEYLITYHVHDDQSEKTEAFSPEIPFLKIGGLSPATKYFFRVQTNSIAGLSPPSPWSDEVETDPEKSLSLKILEDSVLVQDSKCQLPIYTPKAKAPVCDGLQKIEIGEATSHFREKTMMVVGATGVGKTTFLNSLSNFVYDVQENDQFR